MASTVQFAPDTPCDHCGRLGAYRFDGRSLCLDCYSEQGTCGAGGGGDEPPEWEPAARARAAATDPLAPNRPRTAEPN